MGEGSGGHTDTFKNIARNVFGHTDYVHMLLSGDYEEYETKIKSAKQKIKIGSVVEIKMKSVERKLGYVIGIYGKTIKVILKDGKIYGIGYSLVEKVSNTHDPDFEKVLKDKGFVSKKEQKKIDKKIAKQTETLKSILKKGMIIKIRLKGKVVQVTIISVNPKRLRVETQNGKHWYVPYQYVVQ